MHTSQGSYFEAVIRQLKRIGNRRDCNGHACFVALFWILGGQIPMLAMNVDKGTLVYNQSQKHPYKLEFVGKMPMSQRDLFR